MSFNSRFTATEIIGQRKAFFRQRIPESSCVRKQTVDVDILVTSRNSGRKIMQSIRITSRRTWPKRKWNQLRQFWRIPTKITPIQKTSAGDVLRMSQGFKRSNKWRTNRKKARNSCRNALPCANLLLKLPRYFYLLRKKPLDWYFQVRSLY